MKIATKKKHSVKAKLAGKKRSSAATKVLTLADLSAVVGGLECTFGNKGCGA